MSKPASNLNINIKTDEDDSKTNSITKVEEKEKAWKNTWQTWYDWEPVTNAIRVGDIEYVQSLINNREIDINLNHDPEHKATLLHKAAIFGRYDICQMLLAYGAKTDIKDKYGNTPYGSAVRFGNFHIQILLLFNEIGVSASKSAQIQIANMKRQDSICKFLFETLNSQSKNDIVSSMIASIENIAPFSDDMLIFAWQYTIQECKNKGTDALNSPLFESIVKNFEKLISNTSDKKAWNWLKNYLIPSTLWLRNTPTMNNDRDQSSNKAVTADEKTDEKTEVEFDIQGTLFEELLIRVEKESGIQVELDLTNKINQIQTNMKDEWNKMIKFDYNSSSNNNKELNIARQDKVNFGIKSEYNIIDFYDFKCEPSFDPKLHYDIELYLNELILKANLINHKFQKDVSLLTQKIKQVMFKDSSSTSNDNDNDDEIKRIEYLKGPVKDGSRSKNKVQNDYFHEKYPTAAHLLDLIRCTIIFEDIRELNEFLPLFVEQIESKTSCIIGIVRCKNGWNEIRSDLSNLKYVDIKLNVIVKSDSKDNKNGKEFSLVGEIQFLLKLMSNFKLKAHSLYGIERLQEFVANIKKLKPLMIDFEKELFTLASHGDSKGLMLFLVNNMLNINDILNYYDKNGHNILSPICKQNHAKLFRLLKKMYNNKDKFWELLTKTSEKNKFNAVKLYYVLHKISTLVFLRLVIFSRFWEIERNFCFSQIWEISQEFFCDESKNLVSSKKLES